MFKKKSLYQVGKPLLISGLLILILGLIYFLLPWISKQTSFIKKQVPLPSTKTTYIVCLQKEVFSPLKTYLHQWQQLNNQQTINLVTFNNYPLENCNVVITTNKISDNSQILYSFSGILVALKKSPILTSLSLKNLLELKKNNLVVNLLPLAIEGVLPTTLTTKQSLEQNKLYILSANNINQHLGKIKLINLANRSLLKKNKKALIAGEIYITENITMPSIIPLRGYLQTFLTNNLFDISSLDKVVISGRSKIGATGDFIYKVALPKQQIDTLKTADLTILANQTALSDRCSQHLNAVYLCGRLTSWQKFAPYFNIVFQYGKSSLHYDYDDFIRTLELYAKESGQVIGATSDQDYQQARFETSNHFYNIYGFNLGVRPQFCANQEANLPGGLICVNSIAEIKQQITTQNDISLVYIYAPHQFNLKSLKTILDGSTQVVILLTPNNKVTKVTWHTIKGIQKAVIQPRDYWIINSATDIKNLAKVQLPELYFYKSKLFWIK